MEPCEHRAQEVLERVPGWLWDGETLPVPVDDIVDSCFGLHVREVEDLRAAPGAPALAAGQTLSGLLFPGDREIWVNAEEARRWPARRRFTICHELGHWCLHRDSGADDAPVFCRQATIDPPPDVPAAEIPEIEREAHLFAAALLMPAELLRREYARDRDFESLCRRFRASRQAMGRRLHRVI